MSFLMTAGGVALVLFLLAYIRDGRFGASILAMTAGMFLASLWTDTLVNVSHVTLPGITWHDAVYGGIVLLPGMLLLILAHKQHSIFPRLVAAVGIALFGTAAVLPILGVGAEGYELYALIKQYRDLLLTVCIILGLIDIVAARPPKVPKHGHTSHD